MAFPDLRCVWRPRVAFLGFCVGVACFPRDRRPRGGVPPILRSRGPPSTRLTLAWLDSSRFAFPWQESPRQRQSGGKKPRQRQIRGTRATPTSNPWNASRSRTDGPLFGSNNCCLVEQNRPMLAHVRLPTHRFWDWTKLSRRLPIRRRERQNTHHSGRGEELDHAGLCEAQSRAGRAGLRSRATDDRRRVALVRGGHVRRHLGQGALPQLSSRKDRGHGGPHYHQGLIDILDPSGSTSVPFR